MNASRLLAVAALAAVTSFGAYADEADGSQFGIQFNGSRTRAEVKAEAIAAVGDRSQELAALGIVKFQSSAVRADVRAEAAKAVRLGQIPAGEASI